MCDICHMGFRAASYLLEHKRAHSGKQTNEQQLVMSLWSPLGGCVIVQNWISWILGLIWWPWLWCVLGGVRGRVECTEGVMCCG